MERVWCGRSACTRVWRAAMAFAVLGSVSPLLSQVKVVDKDFPGYFHATVACEAYIESLLKRESDYPYRWAGGALGGLFTERWSIAYTQGSKLGKLILMGDMLQVQNAFGAWRKHAHICTYDLEEKTASAFAMLGSLDTVLGKLGNLKEQLGRK